MIKVFPLTIGATKVPFGQFYGGLAGWTGLGALLHMATDKTHPILVPIMAFLIDHPTAGPILVDTGISREQAHAHTSYYRGAMGLVTDADEYLLDDDQMLPAQLERFGYRCVDIQQVVLTHLHEDHVGGLDDVAHARVTLPQREWDLRQQRYLGLVPAYYARSFQMVEHWALADFRTGPLHGFDSSHDLLGDGTIRLLPTPGHTGGHASVLVQADGYQILLAGDALYTLRHLAVDQLRAFVPGNRQRVVEYVDSIRRIQALRAALPDLVVIPTHEHSDYGHALVYPALADGALSPQERDAIRAYEAAVFAEGWRLREEALPAYVPPTAPGAGVVVFGNS